MTIESIDYKFWGLRQKRTELKQGDSVVLEAGYSGCDVISEIPAVSVKVVDGNTLRLTDHVIGLSRTLTGDEINQMRLTKKPFFEMTCAALGISTRVAWTS